MAAFPSSDKTFTTKVDGVDYPQASHINDLQGEVSALELFLLSAPPSGTMWNGKFSVTEASNICTVALKNNAGNNPSSSDPVYININGTVRIVSSSLSVSLGKAVNYFNSGSAELATLAVPYFIYAIWDSNSSAVALTVARKPYYRIVASGMATTTSENYIYGYGGFTDGDDVANIGYFEATLSAGAGYTWTVPTFTGDNLRHEPTESSRWMSWTPTITGYSANPTDTSYNYRIYGQGEYEVNMSEDTAGTSNATTKTYTMPFIANSKTYLPLVSPQDNGSLQAAGLMRINAAANTSDAFLSAFGAWTASSTARILSAKGFIRI